MAATDALLAAPPPPALAVRLAVVLAAGAASWWIYVPVHELAHVAGCLAGGGTVTRLDLDPLYGAALLARIFPFVRPGSDYAGQLTGFDTGGSDLTYLLTDFLPFVLTIVAGVPLLRLAARPGWSAQARAVFLGVSIPLAMAPFISLTGDYYEMGSIVVSRAVAAFSPGFAVVRWRSDDLFKLVAGRFGAGGDGGIGDAAGMAAGLATGIILAFATYGAGSLWARWLLGPLRPAGS